MKRTSVVFVPCFSVLVLLAMPLCMAAQEESNVRGHRHAKLQYNISDLGTLGGPLSFAYGLNNKGHVGGNASLPDGSSHAFLAPKVSERVRGTIMRSSNAQLLGNPLAKIPIHLGHTPFAVDLEESVPL